MKLHSMYLHIINIGLKIFDETETCSQNYVLLTIGQYLLYEVTFNVPSYNKYWPEDI